MSKKKILLASYGGGHVNMLTPVYKELQKNNSLDVHFFAFTTAQIYLQKNNINYLSYKDFIKEVDLLKVNNYGSKLLELETQEDILNPGESLAYHGRNFLELIRRYKEDEAFKLYQCLKRQSFYPLSFMVEVLDKLRPDLVISTNSPRSEQALLEASHLRDIKSICVVDLFNLDEFRQRLYQNSYGSKICVFSDQTKTMLSHSGRDPESIVVTGNPSFDNYLSPPSTDDIKIFKEERGLKEKVILYARTHSQRELALSQLIEDALISFAKNNIDYSLVIRLHPNEEKKYVDLEDNIYISTKEDDLKTLLFSSHIVLAIASTVLIEAHLAGAHVLQYPSDFELNRLDFSKIGVAKKVQGEEELIKEINKLIRLNKNKNHHQVLAAKNISNLALDLLSTDQ